MTTRYRATVSYDGTAYQGFQRQAEGIPTIQAALEAAITAISGQTVTVIGAGRTDTGVHATGQVIAFDLNWKHSDDALLRAINANLRGDIALQTMRQHPGFHPRFDAISRTYRYTVIQAVQPQPLLRLRTWRVYTPLDFDLMQNAAGLLIGEHDFATFGQPPQGESTVRQVIRSEWIQTNEIYGRMLTYSVEANAFLQHMVRRMVGMMVDVGRGALGVGEFEDRLHGADLTLSKTVAPPQGLILEFVRYNE